MSGRKSDTVNLQHAEINDRIAGDLKRGVSRRDVMRSLPACLMGYTFAEHVWFDA